MRDREIELDAERRPCPAVSDVGLLDRRIGIEHRLAANLVDAGVNVPADVRQHAAPQIFILQINRAPGMGHALRRQILAQRIGIAEIGGRVLIERRVGVGRALLIRGQRERSLPNADCFCRGFRRQQQ